MGILSYAITNRTWSNALGTSDRTCSCGSWKQHWLNYSGFRWPATCSVEGCGEKPTLGAHVKEATLKENFIVPMCDQCNQRTDTFSLKASASPVSEDKCVPKAMLQKFLGQLK